MNGYAGTILRVNLTDKTITKELKAAADTLGIRVLDHVILARDNVLSMVEEKIL